MIYAIDPGVKACGVACFTHTGFLNWARYVEVKDLRWLSPVAVTLLIEMPRFYPGRQKGDVNDLLDLAAVVGYCEALFEQGEQKRFFPAEWKGQVPKKIMTARILKQLIDYERDSIVRVGAKDHNTIDAVGIGLHYFKRL